MTRWLPVLAWAGVIFAFSSVSHLGTGLGTWDHVLRKCAHATEYAVLAGLLVRATSSYPWAFALAVAYATRCTRRSCGAGTGRRSTSASTPSVP